jgi:hypothetical protein
MLVKVALLTMIIIKIIKKWSPILIFMMTISSVFASSLHCASYGDSCSCDSGDYVIFGLKDNTQCVSDGGLPNVNATRDSLSNTCSNYDSGNSICGTNDTFSFVSSNLCCSCGGGDTRNFNHSGEFRVIDATGSTLCEDTTFDVTTGWLKANATSYEKHCWCTNATTVSDCGSD